MSCIIMFYLAKKFIRFLLSSYGLCILSKNKSPAIPVAYAGPHLEPIRGWNVADLPANVTDTVRSDINMV